MASAVDGIVDAVATRAFVSLRKSFERRGAIAAERRGERLGELLFRLDGKHRRRTEANLAVAFPEWSEAERARVSVEVFRHFGRVTGDFLYSPSRSASDVLASVEVEGIEHYERAEALGKGIIAATAHFGNWERFGHWLTAFGKRIAVVARESNQKGVQAEIARIRERTGIEVIPRGRAAREVLARLRNREIVGLLMDQNTDESFVPFFRKPCGTVLGPAVMHQRTGAALLPSYCARTGPDRYRVIVLPAIDPENEMRDVVAVTAQLNAALESVVRRYPEQYLWMHDRWRSARERGLL